MQLLDWRIIPVQQCLHSVRVIKMLLKSTYSHLFGCKLGYVDTCLIHGKDSWVLWIGLNNHCTLWKGGQWFFNMINYCCIFFCENQSLKSSIFEKLFWYKRLSWLNEVQLSGQSMIESCYCIDSKERILLDVQASFDCWEETHLRKISLIGLCSSLT